MKPSTFGVWLEEMKLLGRITTDKDAAELLGIAPNTVVLWKTTGPRFLPKIVELACARLLQGKGGYPDES